MIDDELKDFPVEKIEVREAYLGGSLFYNPYSRIAPGVRFGLTADLAPISLGKDAPAPDLWGSEVKTELRLGGIVLPKRPWVGLHHSYGPVEDLGESSTYVSDVHNPIDIERVTLRHTGTDRFNVGLILNLAFEYEASGFRDVQCAMEFEARFVGVSFHVPQWTDPDAAANETPDSWQVPRQFDEKSVAEFFARFLDIDGYHMVAEPPVFRMEPVVPSLGSGGPE